MNNELPESILETIFAYVEHSSSSLAVRNCQLARLAQVCKRWSTFALNLLWQRCNDLSPLLQTVPKELLTLNDTDGSLSFAHNPRPEDLSRFMLQSQRIRDLRYFHQSPDILYRLGPDVVAQLLSCQSDLFPKLQRLHFTSAAPSGWRLLPKFVTSRLTHLILDFRFNVTSVPEALEAIFLHLQSFTQNLQTFVVKSHEDNADLFTLTSLVSHLPLLRKVQCPMGGSTFPTSFHNLSSLKTLLFADLRVHVGTFDLDQLVIRHDSFRSLKTLYLDATISFYTPLIQNLRSSALNNIRLVLREQCPCPTESFQSLIQYTCSATSSLQVLSLKILSPRSRRSLSNFPSAAVLLPLFAHRRLEELVVDLGVPIHLSDADIDTIAYMWPNLRKMRLTAGISPHTADGWKPRATCRAVITLLYHLQSLEELAFEFDGSTLDSVGRPLDPIMELVTPSNSTENALSPNGHTLITSHLKLLDVGYSTPGIPLNVACWIFVLCPQLKQLRWLSDSEDWGRTNAILKMVQNLYTADNHSFRVHVG